MKKSIYSLVLSDDIINKIDDMAYKSGVSRSSMINNILAEHISYITPEKQIKNLFDIIESNMPIGFITMPKTSDGMIQVKKALRYKYSPTIKYSVVFYTREDYYIGELRVSLRTQNIDCLKLFEVFFNLWEKIEEAYTGNKPDGFYSLDRGAWKRKILYSDIFEADIAENISDYIKKLDTCLQYYYSNYSDSDIVYKIEQMYIE